ncbi:hypothetical protein MMC07_000842 [Pseudocyphellaria aurata]|nr:hypothetical protein [Pseudocyphellaria aurata]
MGYSIYSTSDQSRFPDEFLPDYFKVTITIEPEGKWNYSSRKFPNDPIPRPVWVRTKARKPKQRARKAPRAPKPVKAQGGWDSSALREIKSSHSATHADAGKPPKSSENGTTGSKSAAASSEARENK